MKTILMLALLSVISITACTSNNTPKTQYYLLNSPTLALNATVNEQQPAISVTLLELPEYLAQPSLVLQLSDHQLHYSHFHMWAEPLNLGLAQALNQDLNNNKNGLSFIVSADINANKDADIIIKISAFQATHQSQVLLTGSYTINDKLMSQQMNKTNNFSLFVDLDDNGYPHAVEKMRQATSLLAQEISANITKH